MTKKTTRTRAEAKRLMWEYYRENRESLPKWIHDFREEILAELFLYRDAQSVFEGICEKGHSITNSRLRTNES